METLVDLDTGNGSSSFSEMLSQMDLVTDGREDAVAGRGGVPGPDEGPTLAKRFAGGWKSEGTCIPKTFE